MDWNQSNELIETLKAILAVLEKIAGKNEPKAEKSAKTK